METVEYKKIAEFEKTYWWHKGKLYLLDSLLASVLKKLKARTSILEIGCGTGITLQALEKWGDVTGLDVSEEALSYCKNLGLKKLIHGDLSAIDLGKYRKSFDLVVALDVLEHIQDDVSVIKKVKTLLTEDGVFLINVPAHKFLWSEHDEALHHKRRYKMNELVRKLEDAGFNIIKKSYFVAAPFIGIAAFRLWNNFFGKSVYAKSSYITLPNVINTLLIKWLEFEAFLVTTVGIPMGTTIVVVAVPSKPS